MFDRYGQGPVPDHQSRNPYEHSDYSHESKIYDCSGCDTSDIYVCNFPHDGEEP